ncbi:MAG: GNAT family N-acetyltransferase [Rhizobiaceae bacterium]|nr:GNAT family N-acetyltransferase [Rhizobiaceae bacterium]
MNCKVEQMSLSHDQPMTVPSQSVDPEAPLLGEIGHLQTRLARSQAEISAAQAVRYEVFYREMGGCPNEDIRQAERDQDAFDPFCDHLLVLDAEHDEAQIVGTYRMMRQVQAKQAGAFYSQSEYDLAPMLASNQQSNLLELGRSCILSSYRNKRTMELLWHGTWAHAVANHIDIMFGCASFEGTDPDQFGDCLSWLAENAALSSDEDCPAVASNQVNLSNFSSASTQPVSVRQAMAKMPPLIKGYLRLGAKIATHAVIDEQFGTIDVLVVLKVAQINPRYLAHFGVDASRFTV